jgi:hypothetical protein
MVRVPTSDLAPITNLLASVAGLSGAAGLVWGVYVYQGSQRAKRAETLFQLVREFDKSEEFVLAKRLLDGFVYNFPDSIDMGINYFSYSHLNEILRDDAPAKIIDKNEIRVRDSFSSLFDFFDRVAYLFSNGLLKRTELSYFAFFINRARENYGALQFARIYEFRWNEELPVLEKEGRDEKNRLNRR